MTCSTNRHTLLPGYGFGFPYLGWPAYYAAPQQQTCCTVGIISPSTLTIEAGVPLAVSLIAMGGPAPYVFTLDQGALPDGVTLSLSGELTGTPTAASGTTYCFTVVARDDCGQVTYKPYQGTL